MYIVKVSRGGGWWVFPGPESIKQQLSASSLPRIP